MKEGDQEVAGSNPAGPMQQIFISFSVVSCLKETFSENKRKVKETLVLRTHPSELKVAMRRWDGWLRLIWINLKSMLN